MSILKKSATADRILDEALTLFSTHGFQGVSVEMIAKSVGIKASSLYKHYKSKQHIFDAIFLMMKENYKNKEHQLNIPQSDAEIIQFYKDITTDGLYEISRALFLYYLEDDIEVKFRHLLTIEQYQDKNIAQILQQRYYSDPLNFQSKIFQILIEEGIIKNEDAHITALHFFSPILALMTSCEQGALSKDKALNHLFLHIKQFKDLYYL